MVIRFKHVWAIEDKLRRYIDRAQHMWDGRQIECDGITVDYDYTSSHFYLKNNLDLYIDDDFVGGIHGDICGQMLMVMRCGHFLEENSALIIPDANHPGYRMPPFGKEPVHINLHDIRDEEWPLPEHGGLVGIWEYLTPDDLDKPIHANPARVIPFDDPEKL